MDDIRKNNINEPEEIQVEIDPTSLEALVDPLDKEKPDSVLFHFYLNIMKGDCAEAWKMFSKYSQQKILDTAYDEMKETEEFYMQNDITSKADLRRAFEENFAPLKETFWLQFAMNSHADYMVEFADYRTKNIKGNKALVEAVLKRTDGQETKLPFNMVYEDSSWRVAMIETADDN
jgi:hypothetical protein